MNESAPRRNQTIGGQQAVFRRVDAARAGPAALGILVPPGTRTLLILRPRTLDWDLLPLAEDGEGFRLFGREEAAVLARRVPEALEQAAQAGNDPFFVRIRATGDGCELGVHLLELSWLVCRRVSGRPYVPLRFPSPTEAEDAAELLR